MHKFFFSLSAIAVLDTKKDLKATFCKAQISVTGKSSEVTDNNPQILSSVYNMCCTCKKCGSLNKCILDVGVLYNPFPF